MIVVYPPKPGEPIDKYEAMFNACSALLTFATTKQDKVRQLRHLNYEFFEISSPEAHQKAVNGLVEKIGTNLNFRNYYNDQGKLCAVTVSNFAKFLPPSMEGWTFVDDHTDEFTGRIN